MGAVDQRPELARRQREAVRQFALLMRREVLLGQAGEVEGRTAGAQHHAAGIFGLKFDLGPVGQLAHDVVQRMHRRRRGAIGGDIGCRFVGDPDIHIRGREFKLTAIGLDQHVGKNGNRVATFNHALDVAQRFHRLTEAPMVITSVKGNRNRKELLHAVVEHLPEAGSPRETAPVDDPVMKLAIVGRRNVGKSTFINQLAQEERVIVSEVPGTTRDSVDVRFEMDDQTFVAIDTPGVRKRKSLANDIEYYGLIRAQKSIRRADVVLMFFDASQTISRVDKQLVDEIHAQQKPCIFVVNKWDLGLEEEMTAESWGEYLLKTFGTMRHVPVAFLTAIDGKNIRPVINLAQTIFKQARERVPTPKLNDVIRAAVKANPPPYRRNKRPKIFYAAQVAITPPTIVLKCNDPRLFDAPWKRYLLGVFREMLPFQEVPIRVYYRKRQRDDEFEETQETETVEAAAGE